MVDDSPEGLLRQADKKARGSALAFLTGPPNYYEASKLYEAAGNKYKLMKKPKEAAECFMKVAFMQEKMNDNNATATAYVEAGNLLRKEAPRESAQHYDKAISIYNTNGRFSQSAKLMKSIAESAEEAGDIIRAAEHYKKAAEYSEMDDFGKSTFTQCIVKYADLGTKADPSPAKLREASKIYEKEAEKALRNTLTQYGAKDHLFKAGILILALGDPVDAKISCAQYEESDPRFASSREGKLLRALVTAFEGGDRDGFVEALRDFDSITKLDAWKVYFLNKVKDMMTPVAERMMQEDDDRAMEGDTVDMT